MPLTPQSHMVITTLRSIALRTLRLGGRQFAGGDAVGPVGIEVDALRGPEPGDRERHVGHGLAGLDAALPGLARNS